MSIPEDCPTPEKCILINNIEQRYHELITNINSGVIQYEYIDNQFILKDFNKAALRTSTRYKDVINKPVLKGFPGIEKMGLLEIMLRVQETGEPEFHPKLYYKDDKMDGWFTNYIYKLSSGEIIAIFDDITDRIITENVLIAAKEKAEESDRLKTSFLANMSHEIRTPMNAIVGFSDLLAHLPQDTPIEDREEYVKHISNSTDSLLHLIDDIIDIAKIEAGELKINKNQKCFINTMLDELKIEHLEYDNFTIKKNIPYEDFSILTDPYRLKQILTNLINNATKFTDGGSIIVGYEIQENDILFYVEDSGIGIEECEIEHIFDRFRRVDHEHKIYSGMGLGLNIGKSLSILLGGDMTVESKVDKGTKFMFNIPLSGVSTKTISHKRPITEMINGNYVWPNKTILIAEDDKLNILYLEEVLRISKVKLLCAGNGAEAIKLFEDNWDEIDLALLDLKMPIKSGYEVIEEIRKIDPEIPIIIQTAHAIATEKQKAIDLGCDEYLTKPLRALTLLKTIKKYLK